MREAPSAMGRKERAARSRSWRAQGLGSRAQPVPRDPTNAGSPDAGSGRVPLSFPNDVLLRALRRALFLRRGGGWSGREGDSLTLYPGTGCPLCYICKL